MLLSASKRTQTEAAGRGLSGRLAEHGRNPKESAVVFTCVLYSAAHTQSTETPPRCQSNTSSLIIMNLTKQCACNSVTLCMSSWARNSAVIGSPGQLKSLAEGLPRHSASLIGRPDCRTYLCVVAPRVHCLLLHSAVDVTDSGTVFGRSEVWNAVGDWSSTWYRVSYVYLKSANTRVGSCGLSNLFRLRIDLSVRGQWIVIPENWKRGNYTFLTQFN